MSYLTAFVSYPFETWRGYCKHPYLPNGQALATILLLYPGWQCGGRGLVTLSS